MLGSPDLSLLRFLCLEEMKTAIITILYTLPHSWFCLSLWLTLFYSRTQISETWKTPSSRLLLLFLKKASLGFEIQQGG